MNQRITLSQLWHLKRSISLTLLFFCFFLIKTQAQEQVVFSEWFSQPDNDESECTAWEAFSQDLTADKNYLSVLFKGSLNETGLLLEDRVKAAELAAAIKNNENTSFTANGQFWVVEVNSGSAWVSASSLGTLHSTTNCVSGAEYFTLRACLENGNYGGVSGTTCSSPSQRIDLIFTYGGVALVNNSPATCTESSDGSLTVKMEDGDAPYTFEWSNGVVTSSGQNVNGYTLLGHYESHSYYRSINQAGTMEAAQAAAEANYGNVASITSAEENAWLIANGAQVGDNLGGSDQAQEGSWTWASGESFSYTNWAPGEPNNGSGNQNNMQIYADGTWDDILWAANPGARHIVELPAVSKIENLAPGDYTVTVTDANGVVTSSTFTVGPSPIEIDFNMTESSSCDEVGDGELEAVVTGGNAPYTYVWSSGETDAVITNKAIGEYTVTVTDANGCASVQASETIAPLDNADPVAIAEAYTVELDADGEVTLTAAVVAQFIGSGSTDNCSLDAASHVLSQMVFSCEDLGANTLTYSVADAAGNSDDAAVVITVVDEIAPSAVAQNIVAQLDENGVAVISALDADNGSADNCSIASRVLSITEFTCADIGEHEVTLTITDASGNESQDTFTVDVVDQMAPVIPEALSVTLYLDESGEGVFNSAPLLAQASDNCGLDAIVVHFENEEYIDIDGLPFSCEDVGSSSGSIFVRDNSGNLASFLLNLTVLDTIKPSFSLESIDLQLDEEGNAEITEEMLLQYASDNCSVAEVAIQYSSFDCSMLSAAQYTEIIVFDVNGNATQKTLEVKLRDTMAPHAQVANISIELNQNGQADLNVDMLDMMVMDNCEAVSFQLSQTNFSCADLGTHTLTITVGDAAGNVETTGFVINVEDNTAPLVAGPEVIQLCEGVPVSYDQIVATDNCSVELSLIDGPQAGDTPTAGEYMVEFEALDGSGNSTTKMVLLDISETPEVNLGGDMEVEAGEIITLVAGENDTFQYNWSNGSTGPVYAFTAMEDITVSVEVITPDGCTATDEIVVSVSHPLGIDDDAAGNNVRFYPNPTNGQMSIALSLTEVATDVRLNIMDISGKTVAQQTIPTAKDGDVISLDIASYADGIYLISLQSDSFTITKRIVKN